MDEDIKNLYELSQIHSKAIIGNAKASLWNSLAIAILAVGIIIIALRG